MNLRTELSVAASPWKLEVKDRVVTLGSCFAATMGTQLAEHKVSALINPFGTTYHPLAIDRLLNCALNRELPSSSGFVRRNDTWLHYDFHSSFSASGERQLADQLESQLKQVQEGLQNATVLILTYGTAFQYELADTGRPVANCHRMPASTFRRRLASVDEIVNSARNTLADLRTLNPQLRIILTVSPVRHVKDTLPLNSVSKSTLLLACHRLNEIEANVDYFPAYELIMDDLRDYRFYKDDLIHPTPFAEEYIWKKFCETYASADMLRFLEEWQSLRQALQHRPIRPQGKEHQEFLVRTIERLRNLRDKADVEKEIKILESQLLSHPVT